MMGEVFIDLDRAVFGVDGLKPAPGMSGGFCSGRALAQEEDVGRDFRSGIAFEGGIGKADRAEQVGALGEIGCGCVSSCLSIV